MDRSLALKALADETRMKILTLLLKHNYCVRALARSLALSEAAVSQHLKVLRDAGLLTGEKRGYFMHYDVKRTALCELAKELEALAAIEREACTPDKGGCSPAEHEKCHAKGECGEQTKKLCHGKNHTGEGGHHGHCQCHEA